MLAAEPYTALYHVLELKCDVGDFLGIEALIPQRQTLCNEFEIVFYSLRAQTPSASAGAAYGRAHFTSRHF
jgi:hypothetical protein